MSLSSEPADQREIVQAISRAGCDCGALEKKKACPGARARHTETCAMRVKLKQLVADPKEQVKIWKCAITAKGTARARAAMTAAAAAACSGTEDDNESLDLGELTPEALAEVQMVYEAAKAEVEAGAPATAQPARTAEHRIAHLERMVRELRGEAAAAIEREVRATTALREADERIAAMRAPQQSEDGADSSGEEEAPATPAARGPKAVPGRKKKHAPAEATPAAEPAPSGFVGKVAGQVATAMAVTGSLGIARAIAQALTSATGQATETAVPMPAMGAPQGMRIVS